MSILFITNINIIIWNKLQRILQQATENFATSYREFCNKLQRIDFYVWLKYNDEYKTL